MSDQSTEVDTKAREREIAIVNARAALFRLQNTYPHDSEDFCRVYQLRIEIDRLERRARENP